MRTTIEETIALALLLLGGLLVGCGAAKDRDTRPNVLVILVDDLGYSDTQPFGGEIPTPNLGALANEGTRYTNFHTAMKCNPTRAMLLTGLDNNIGATGDRRTWHVLAEFPTLAEKLGDAGYLTLMSGKWDAGNDAGQRPFDRGFEQTFSLLPAVQSHFREPDSSDQRDDGTTSGYSVNGQNAGIPEDFYSTSFYSDKMIELIEANRDDPRPFFAYLSYTAPHYPLHAPDEYIERFDGWYEDGYQAIHAARVSRLHQLGLFSESMAAWSLENVTDWSTLTDDKRAYEAKRMQVYAAMIAALDDGIGKVLDYLDSTGLDDNTLVIFASDNGADGTLNGAGYRDTHVNDTENLGRPDSYVTQGFSWAQVSSTPLRMVKSHPTEGGTRSPMIARWPGKIESAAMNDEWFRISDVHQAILELAGLPAAAKSAYAMTGRSALPVLLENKPIYSADETIVHTYVEGRRLGGASVLRGDWKLVWWKTSNVYAEPMLFNLADDPYETTDLAAEHPDIVTELATEWRTYQTLAGEHIAEADPSIRN